MDADTLLLKDLEDIFGKIKEYSFVVYDYQHKDPSHVYDISSPNIYKIFDEKRIREEVFCTGFWASKKGVLSEVDLGFILMSLRGGDAEILYPRAPEQSLLNYIRMKKDLPIYNFAISGEESKRIGNCVVSSHFKKKNHILYDKGEKLTYLHYIGIPAEKINKVCSGENLDFPYRDIFLYYRFMNEPERRLELGENPKKIKKPLGLFNKLRNRLDR